MPSNSLRLGIRSTRARIVIAAALAGFLSAVCSGQTPPLGTEFEVNPTGYNPTIALQDSGDFVVVWSGVSGRRFNAAGQPQGPAFPISTATSGTQRNPSVGGDSSGGFVVAWEGFGLDGSDTGIEVRRFDSSGLPLGDALPVNTYTTGFQIAPSVAVNPSGSFVVVWKSAGKISARQYDVAGDPLGDEFQINQNAVPFLATPPNDQTDSLPHLPRTSEEGSFGPSVSSDSAGNFVVAWRGRDGYNSTIVARRFDSSGAPLGDEFQVKTPDDYHSFSQPSVRANASGEFVVAWQTFDFGLEVRQLRRTSGR